MSIRLILALSLLVSCGEEPAKEDDPKSNSPTDGVIGHSGGEQVLWDSAKLYNLEADMPPCNQGQQDSLAYVNELQTFFSCDVGEWVEIDLGGAVGAKGDKGDTGATGVAGTNGAAGGGPYLVIKDGNGDEIGTSYSFLSAHTGSNVGEVLFSDDGFASSISKSTGKFQEMTNDAVYYESVDCTGDGYYRSLNVLMDDGGAVVKSSNTYSTITYNSSYDVGSCDAGSQNAEMAKIEAHTLPAGLTYPIPLPMTAEVVR